MEFVCCARASQAALMGTNTVAMAVALSRAWSRPVACAAHVRNELALSLPARSLWGESSAASSYDAFPAPSEAGRELCLSLPRAP